MLVDSSQPSFSHKASAGKALTISGLERSSYPTSHPNYQSDSVVTIDFLLRDSPS